MNARAHEAAKDLEHRMPDWKLSYRIDEAAAATGYGKSKLWELIKDGKLPAKKDGGVTVIRRADLQAYLDNLPSREANHHHQTSDGRDTPRRSAPCRT